MNTVKVYEQYQELLAVRIAESEDAARTIGEAMDSGEYEHPSEEFDSAQASLLAHRQLIALLSAEALRTEQAYLVANEARRNEGIKAAVSHLRVVR